MSRDFRALPVVDIRGLSALRKADRMAAARAIGEAAREAGFFYVTGHGLPEGLSSGLLAAAERLFSLPLERKMAWYIAGSANHSGYVPEGEEVFASGKIDLKEAYDVGLDCPRGEAGVPMLGPNLWPESAGFREAVSAYYAAVAALARRMFRGIALALDLPEDHFEPHLHRPPSQLRLIHYPYDAAAEPDQEGIGAHTDYEFFTILQTTGPGLEVMNGEGRWIDAPPRPGCFVVNIGDMLEAWTNGAFTATAHRVRKVAAERYSFPFFATCDYWTEVAPHPCFVDEARPARYPPLVSGEHLYAQTAKTFAYLKARRERGELALETPDHGFGQAAKRAAPAVTLEELAASAPFAQPPAVPAWTLGCFHRRCITYATGTEDVATRVIWIQSHGLTGDIRVPEARPDIGGRSGLGDCSPAELAALARSEGGVAETAWADGRMRWDNWAAFQPYDKWPEPGELRRVGTSLIEFAPSGIYVEDWRAQTQSSGLLAGLRLTHEAGADGRRRPRDGGLVVAGEHAILALARRQALPDARPAQAQIADAADPYAAAELVFDAEASYALGGRITLSTNPFREGETLSFDGFAPGPEPGVIVQRLGEVERWWRVDTLLDGQDLEPATAAEPAALAWLQREGATPLAEN